MAPLNSTLNDLDVNESGWVVYMYKRFGVLQTLICCNHTFLTARYFDTTRFHFGRERAWFPRELVGSHRGATSRNCLNIYRLV